MCWRCFSRSGSSWFVFHGRMCYQQPTVPCPQTEEMWFGLGWLFSGKSFNRTRLGGLETSVGERLVRKRRSGVQLPHLHLPHTALCHARHGSTVRNQMMPLPYLCYTRGRRLIAISCRSNHETSGIYDVKAYANQMFSVATDWGKQTRMDTPQRLVEWMLTHRRTSRATSRAGGPRWGTGTGATLRTFRRD